MSRFAVYWTFLRPFTLLVPAAGMISGALMGLGAPPHLQSVWASSPWGVAFDVAAGAAMAGILNGFSNGINQIFDLEVDRVNKPSRPLPSGRMNLAQAWTVSILCLLTALALGALVNWQCLLMALAAVFFTTIYSAPPLRTKSRGLWANITIAIPRGTLLIVAGWSCVKDIFESPQPWIVGGVFGLFFMGAATTKDFSDIEGDRQGGCRTLPVLYGVRKATLIIAPFFVFPFLGLLAAWAAGLLSADSRILAPLGLLLCLWGAYIARLLLKTSHQWTSAGSGGFENHPSWKHMYLLTLVAQAGLALAYLVA
ncbi:MAG TPA: UbiA family prenyltransferase [Acidobacteriota bacterium]|nr:UbiA family prenyltransferase [Acidobacteriota bacterium]